MRSLTIVINCWHRWMPLWAAQSNRRALPIRTACLATMTARLVNDGHAVKPVLVRSIEGEGNKIPEWPMLGFHKPYLDLIQKGMTEVVNNPRGTGHNFSIKESP
jgi:hypothetical protein